MQHQEVTSETGNLDYEKLEFGNLNFVGIQPKTYAHKMLETEKQLVKLLSKKYVGEIDTFTTIREDGACSQGFHS